MGNLNTSPNMGDIRNKINEHEELLNSIIDKIYPIGCLYWSKNSTDPSTLFGGTWTRVKDKFILAAGDSYSQGATGGAATVTLTTAQMPAHTHTRGTMNITGSIPQFTGWEGSYQPTGAFYFGASNGNNSPGSDDYSSPNLEFDASRNWTGATSSTGSGSAHNNMPPYITYYCWERTA